MEFNRGAAVLTAILLGVSAMSAVGQTVRFDSYQLEEIPENANILIGPFYSDLSFFQSVGIRYIKSSGAGMDYLYSGGSSVPGVGGGGGGGSYNTSSGYHKRYGRVKKDGVDIPLVSQLSVRNYLLISQYMSVDFSFALTYRAFPMGTEDSTFDVEIIDPGFYAHMGSFTYGVTRDSWIGAYNGGNMQGYAGSGGQGFSANLSSDFELTPFVRGRVYDRPSYRIDYVDQRGYTDNLSGQKYPVFQNILGMDLDWQMAPDKSLGYSVNRIDTVPQDNEYDISRSVVWNQNVEYRQQLNPLTAVGARADYVWRDYLGSRGSQKQQDYVAFLVSDVTEDSTINASVGYSLVEMDGAEGSAGGYETNGTSGEMIGGLGINTRLTETLSHNLSYSRSQRAGFIAGAELLDSIRYRIQWAQPEGWSIGYSSAYQSVTPKLVAAASYTDWMNQVAASRPLTHDLVLTLATAYIMRLNTEASAGQLGEGDVYLNNDYDTWVTSVGLIQTLTERLKLYAYAEHLERISSQELLAGTRDTVGMTLGYYYDF